MPALPEFVPSPNAAAGSSAITGAESAAMLRAVFNLFERWQLTMEEGRRLLGAPSPRTYYRWRSGEVGTLPSDTVWRFGELLGIHKALRYMFTDRERGYAWIRAPNTVFPGEVSALGQMLRGAPTDLALVRSYLDAERAGW
ncbi:MAG: MbcA/ParS/Xre antitoxin family protein [Acetobacteraceae bacterium]